MIVHIQQFSVFVFVSLSLEYVRPTNAAIHLPLVRTERTVQSAQAVQHAQTQTVRSGQAVKRDGATAASGVGDYLDVTYNVLVKIGDNETTLVLDTGSADLWVVSDACTGECSTTVPLYHQSSFRPAGEDVQLLYGDSRTGTHASGPIGQDAVGIAGLTVKDQYMAAITDTNTTVLETGSAGILGLGFPAISVLWRQLLQTQLSKSPPSKRHLPLLDANLHRASFPSFDFLSPVSHPHSTKRQPAPLLSSAQVIDSFTTYGPPFARLALEAPMFAVTLQRDTIDVGGNVGLLSLGQLPAGIRSESLTWVPVRAYTPQEGGLPPPPDAPNEVYPLAWEIAIDDVYFDGKKLARSTLSPSSITLSSLIDTGNSLIRGPEDVISQITSALGGDTFACASPHTLAFAIGGQLFPVDARDLVRQAAPDNVDLCAANLAITDPPALGGAGFLYSWSLGDPFLKSALVAFHYGNLTRPSQDPPRVGLLSTVPADHGDRLTQAVKAAAAADGNFPATSDVAPSGTYAATATGVGGVPQASAAPPNANGTGSDVNRTSSGATRTGTTIPVEMMVVCALLAVASWGVGY